MPRTITGSRRGARPGRGRPRNRWERTEARCSRRGRPVDRSSRVGVASPCPWARITASTSIVRPFSSVTAWPPGTSARSSTRVACTCTRTLRGAVFTARWKTWDRYAFWTGRGANRPGCGRATRRGRVRGGSALALDRLVGEQRHVGGGGVVQSRSGCSCARPGRRPADRGRSRGCPATASSAVRPRWRRSAPPGRCRSAPRRRRRPRS